MNQTGQSQFNQARIEWAIRLRYSPMPKLDPEYMASQLNAFRIGELRVVGKTWEIMMERDAELAVNADKRYSDLAGLGYQVVSDGSPDGDKHAAALTYFYKNLRVTKALDQDSVGKVDDLLYQMASAHSYYYSIHEMLMRIDNPAAREVTAEFRQTPVWFFESRRGYLAFLGHIFDMYGKPCVQGEWLTCVGLGWMRPLSMMFCTKMFTLRDWQIWCLRYAGGFLEGVVDEAPGSTGWEEAKQALQTMANDGAVVHSPKVILKFLEQSARTGMPFSELVSYADRTYAKCYRGVDLATGSRGAESGGKTGGGSSNPVGASVQAEESGIFLLRDAAWATGYLNDRVDRPVLRYLFGQEPRAGIAIMPPLDDTTTEDLAAVQALVPLGLRLALKDVYKRFRFEPPAAGEPCLEPMQPPSLDPDGKPSPVAPAPPSPVGRGQGEGKPQTADETQGATIPAKQDETAPIGAGADPKALAPIASPRMPNTQPDNAGFWSNSGRAMMPSLGYAIPNDAAVKLSDAFLKKAQDAVAASVSDDLSHVAGLIDAANQIEDDGLRAKKYAEILTKLPGITADTLLAPKSAEAIADIVSTAYAAGLQGNGHAVSNDNPNHDEQGRFAEADAVGKVKDVMSGKLDESAYAKVSPETAAKIKAATGRDVTGYQHFIDHDSLVHIDSSHGVGKEDQPGHEPVTKDDIEKIPQIVANPDSVVAGGLSSRKLPTVKYSKRFNGTTYYVEEEWSKEKMLAAKTMYKTKTPGNSATPGGGVSHTSKTSGAKET